MAFVLKTNHIEEALSNLMGQYKGKTNMEGVIKAWGRQFQELENAAFQVYSLWLDTAVGTNLDNIGTIFNVDRAGRSDEAYRRAITTAIFVINGSGTPEDILGAFKIFNPRAYEISEWYKATVIVRAVDAIESEDPSPFEFFYLLNDVKPAGVRGLFHYALVDDSNIFKLAPGDEVVSDSNHGCSDVLGTTGGKLSEILDSQLLGAEARDSVLIDLFGNALVDLSGNLLIERP